MARTIRNTPKTADPRHHFPTSRARKVERRSERRSARVDVRDYR